MLECVDMCVRRHVWTHVWTHVCVYNICARVYICWKVCACARVYMLEHVRVSKLWNMLTGVCWTTCVCIPRVCIARHVWTHVCVSIHAGMCVCVYMLEYVDIMLYSI